MVLDLIIRWAVPFLCGCAVSACGVVWGYIHGQRERDRAMEDGLQSLLRAEIIRSHDKYTDRGYCPIYAREALKRAYDSYHILGGNDVATDLYRQVMALPTEPPLREEVHHATE